MDNGGGNLTTAAPLKRLPTPSISSIIRSGLDELNRNKIS